MARSEYLRFENANLSDSVALELMAVGQILAPNILYEALVQAYEYVITQPGPNLEQRRKLATGWLGYWRESLKKLSKTPETFQPATPQSKYLHSQRIGTLETIGGRLATLSNSGLVTFATGDGTEGHRSFIDRAFMQVDTVCIAFEGNRFFQENPDRRAPYLPLAVRMGMWMLSNKNIYVTVIPDQSPAVSEVDHYRKLFKDSHATRSLATATDPHADEKITRGLLRPTSIPIDEYPSAHTSDRARKLMEELEFVGRIDEVANCVLI